MKKPPTTLFSPRLIATISVLIATALPVALSAAIPQRWTVETSRLQPAQFEAYHGETIEFAATMQSYGKPLAITNDLIGIYWQTNGMGSAYWTAPAVLSNNVMIARFTPEMDVGANVYSCFIGSPGEIYRAAFQLRLRPSPGAVPSELPLPVKTLDFAQVQVLNPPYYSKSETDARIIELAPAPGNYATVSNRAMTAVQPAALDAKRDKTDRSFVNPGSEFPFAIEKWVYSSYGTVIDFLPDQTGAGWTWTIVGDTWPYITGAKIADGWRFDFYGDFDEYLGPIVTETWTGSDITQASFQDGAVRPVVIYDALALTSEIPEVIDPSSAAATGKAADALATKNALSDKLDKSDVVPLTGGAAVGQAVDANSLKNKLGLGSNNAITVGNNASAAQNAIAIGSNAKVNGSGSCQLGYSASNLNAVNALRFRDTVVVGSDGKVPAASMSNIALSQVTGLEGALASMAATNHTHRATEILSGRSSAPPTDTVADWLQGMQLDLGSLGTALNAEVIRSTAADAETRTELNSVESSLAGLHGDLETHNTSTNAHTDIRTALSDKQDTISDLATIRSGAAAGATAVQPSAATNVAEHVVDRAQMVYVYNGDRTVRSDGSGNVYVSEVVTGGVWTLVRPGTADLVLTYVGMNSGNYVWRNGVIYVDYNPYTGRLNCAAGKLSDIASGLNPAAGDDLGGPYTYIGSNKYVFTPQQPLFPDLPTTRFATTNEVSLALDGKQDTISDLTTIRSGAAAGATAVQPSAISDMETQTHAAQTYQPKGSYLTSESDPTVAGKISTHNSSSSAHADIRTAAANAQAHSEATRQIVSTWEGFLDGSNVVFSITNYISGAYSLDHAKLQIKELLPDSNEYRIVYDSRTEITNHTEAAKRELYAVVNSTTAVLRGEIAEKGDKAWGRRSSTGQEVPIANTVWVTEQNLRIAGGMEYERVAVGEGAIYVLTSKGQAPYMTGDEGALMLKDDGGTNYFGMVRSDSYTIGCNTDGIRTQNNLVYLDYAVTMSDHPCIWYTESLEGDVEWEQLNLPDGSAVPGASHQVVWDESPRLGTQECYINCPEGSGFFRATIEVAGDARFRTNMPAEIPSFYCDDNPDKKVKIIWNNGNPKFVEAN